MQSKLKQFCLNFKMLDLPTYYAQQAYFLFLIEVTLFLIKNNDQEAGPLAHYQNAN